MSSAYKKIEIVGTSPASVTEAIQGAIDRASSTVHNLIAGGEPVLERCCAPQKKPGRRSGGSVRRPRCKKLSFRRRLAR